MREGYPDPDPMPHIEVAKPSPYFDLKPRVVDAARFMTLHSVESLEEFSSGMRREPFVPVSPVRTIPRPQIKPRGVPDVVKGRPSRQKAGRTKSRPA
jgi:hypothetical protein